jgi:hypothetical protein
MSGCGGLSRKRKEHLDPKERAVMEKNSLLTGVDGGFSRSHRHVRRVGNETRALHDGLFFAIDLDRKLHTVSHTLHMM